MRNILKLLFGFLEAMIDIAEDKPAKRRIGVMQAEELYDADLISIREYNQAFNRKRF